MITLHRTRSAMRALTLTLITTIAVIAPFICPGNVHAQGTDRALADPIGGRELMKYADRLELSDRQRLALEQLHDGYRQEFALLRDGEIAAFMSSTSKMQGVMPSRDEARELFREWERLRDKVARVDDGLFDRLAPILDEQQAARLPRLRLARERARTGGQQMQMFAGGPIVDLSDIWFEMELDPESAAATDPTLAAYEHRLTAEMRKLAEASARMFMDMFDAMEEAGLADIDMTEAADDPEQLQELMKFWQEIWSDLTARTREIASSMHELNGRTVQSLRAALPPAAATDLRNRYYRRAYPQLRAIVQAIDQDVLGEMLEDETLTDDERTTIEAAHAETTTKLERIFSPEAIKLSEEARRQLNPFDMDADRMRESYQRFAEIQQEPAVAASEGYITIEQAFDLERAGDLQRRAMRRMTGQGADHGHDATAVASAENGPIEAAEIADQPAGLDAMFPTRLTRTDVQVIVSHVGLSDEERVLLDELYSQYRTAFDELPELQAFRKASQSLWKFDPSGGQPTPPTQAEYDQLDTTRRDAFAAILARNDRFCADVAIAMFDANDESRRGRLERFRRMITRRGMMRTERSFGAPAGGSSIDFVDFLLGQSMDESSWAAAEEVLETYESDAAAVFQRRSDAAHDLRRANERWSFEAQKAMADSQRDASAQIALASRYQEIVGGAMERFQATGIETTELNRRTLDELLTALPDEDGATIRRAWRRAAFPDLVNDPMVVDRHITAALELDDLTPDQRRRIEDLAAMYRPEYERLVEHMIDNADGSGFMVPNLQDQDAVRRWTEHRQLLERARFERNDLNYRAIGRLRTVLSEDQLVLIGGLPEPPKNDENDAVMVW